MSENIIDQIVKLWAEINPVAGYTSGYTQTLTTLLFETVDTVALIKDRISVLKSRLNEIESDELRQTAQAILVTQETQLDLARPSGAGPSGTGAGGVYAAADGVFYIVLKETDYTQAWISNYLKLVAEMVVFETDRWSGEAFTIEERLECMNTVTYMDGTLAALQEVNANVADEVKEIQNCLTKYNDLFYSEGLASPDFDVMWETLREGDAKQGPTQAKGYPGTLQNYYSLDVTADQIEQSVEDWMALDMPVTLDLAQRIGSSLNLAADASLQTVWDALSEKYALDFSPEKMQEVLKACNDYGQEKIIGFTDKDVVKFDATPDYLVALVTGGEDFAVNYLTQNPFSQLYLTASKNTSMLTMINILVHEASHGFNFVMSARKAVSPLLKLNTSLEVPMTEGQAFYREYQYYAGAAALLGQTNLNPAEESYLNLYGQTDHEQRDAVLGAQLETYIWRVIRYIRALCDVQVNGGIKTYTDFVSWAAELTGLTVETIHGECFTLLAAPGYAPCYAVGGAVYGFLSTKGYPNGVTELSFNTQASAMGFYNWVVDKTHMTAMASGKVDNHV